ncbi:MAG: hypothetical protein OEZ28_14595 [Nitrospinota bacterium]|nr:hypothetical protein [Nitrospinota bacterium]
MRNYQVVSDISLMLVLAPKLEPVMTSEMEVKFTEVLRGELAGLNVHLSSATYMDTYHLFKLTSPPDVSPLAAADLVMTKVTPRFLQYFQELEGWGSIYHDRVFIKTGEEISSQQLDDLLNVSLQGI